MTGRREVLWETFQSRVCDISTERFLRSDDLTRLIAPLTTAAALREATALQAFFCTSHERTVQDIVARRPRIALTNCFLVNYSGSELWTEEVAGYLVRLGLPLIVYAPKLGAVAERMRANGICVTDDPAAVASFEPDVLHVNHHAAAAPVLSSVRNSPVVVNMIHGLLPRPGLPGIEGVDAYCAVGLHAQAKIHLLTGAPWDSIRLVPSFYDAARFKRRRAPDRSKRALVFSSKTAPHHRERLAAILATAGYETDHVGYGGVPNSAPEDLLPNYDLVFAVARSATEALACGCRVILWDAGLAGPLVTGADYWSFAVANFSMAACTLQWRAIDDPIASDWLRDQIANADAGAEACELTYVNLSLERVGPMLLSVYRHLLVA